MKNKEKYEELVGHRCGYSRVDHKPHKCSEMKCEDCAFEMYDWCQQGIESFWEEKVYDK